MKSINNVVEDSILDSSQEYISEKDKKSFKNDILSLMGALSCLCAGFIYSKIYPGQQVICSYIYILGVIIIGLPVLITAVHGLISKDMKSSMEILVSIALIICTLDGQFVLAILIPVILTFVHFLEEKSIMGGRDAIKGLKSMQAKTALLIKDGNEVEVAAKDLKKDDIILVKPGMALPVDGVVIYGTSNIDQKSLTGESVPITVTKNDNVFAGTINIDGSIRVCVTKEYNDTSFQKIVKLLENAENITIPETLIVNKFMFYYIPLTLIISVLVWILTQDMSRAIAILVVSCPCGHMLISSAPMLASLSNATRKGILIKNSAFVEHLPDTDCMIFDKTGTITNGILEAESYHLVKAKDANELVSAAASVAKNSLHPISKSIMALASGMNYEENYETTEVIGKGIKGEYNGDIIYLGSYSWICSLGYTAKEVYDHVGACDWVVKNDRVLGCIIFKDTPRDDAAQIISELKDIGISATGLLTGDHKEAAENIRKQVGIDFMKSDLLPEQKLQYVEKAMKNNTVAIVGDGINDALALSKAHIGIAMGAMGSDTAIQSADIALMNNDLSNIPFVIKLSRITKRIIFQNIIISFASSIIMICLAGAGVVTPIIGAFLHNIGAFTVLLNSARLLSFKGTEDEMDTMK